MRYTMLFAGAALLMAAPAFAEDWDFILVNNSGKEVKTIDLSPTGADKWQPNKLDPEIKSGPLKAGGRTTIHFDKGSDCKYDVKATFADDTNSVWSGINLCDNSYVTIAYKNGTPTYTVN